MFKLSAVAHTRKKITDQEVKGFFFHHPYMGLFLWGIAMPAMIPAAVCVLCFTIMLPISFFMGWL